MEYAQARIETDYDALLARFNEAQAENERLKKELTEKKRLENFYSQASAISSPKIKPTEAKVALALMVEAHKRWKDETTAVPVNDIATNKALGARTGLSDKTAGDTCKKLAHVGIVEKHSDHIAVNRKGQQIEVKDADRDRGDHFVTTSTMAVAMLPADELERKLLIASSLKSANQIGAKDRAKAERKLNKMVKELQQTPCPYCGTVGELHIHCQSCGWKDSDLEQAAPKPAKAKRERTNGKTPPSWTEERKSFLADPDYVPPCPDDLDQLPDEQKTRLKALRGLEGVATSPPMPLNYKDFDDQGIGINLTGTENFSSFL